MIGSSMGILEVELLWEGLKESGLFSVKKSLEDIQANESQASEKRLIPLEFEWI